MQPMNRIAIIKGIVKQERLLMRSNKRLDVLQKQNMEILTRAEETIGNNLRAQIENLRGIIHV